MRITNSHKLLPAVRRGKPVMILVDGQKLEAFQGETLAAALAANGRRAYHYSAKSAEEQLPGFFCGIGICYGCMVMVDGYLRRACVTAVVDGMQVATKPEESS